MFDCSNYYIKLTIRLSYDFVDITISSSISFVPHDCDGRLVCPMTVSLFSQGEIRVNPVVWNKLTDEARSMMHAMLNKDPK